MVYIPYDNLNITNEDEKVCSFLIRNGFFVRNATLFCGDQMVSEHDLVGFKYDKIFTPFIVLTEQKGTKKTSFRDIATISFFLQYFRANIGLYVTNKSPNIEMIEFGQQQKPRVLVCRISNFDDDIHTEVSTHFSGFNHFVKITKKGGRVKKYRKLFEMLWRLSEFSKISLIEKIINNISAERPTSEEYKNVYIWLSKELIAYYSLCLLQILSRTMLVFTPTNRKKMLTKWFKSELTETRENGELSDLQNESIGIIDHLIRNNQTSHRLSCIMNRYLYSSETLSSHEAPLVAKVLKDTSFKKIRQYVER